MHSPTFVTDLAIVLAVASLMGIVFKRLGQSTVLGYLVAGLIVGPYIPIPVFADEGHVHALSELGVVLVMFAVGLELRLKRLFAVLPTAGLTALLEVGALLGAGYGVGLALGWSSHGALFLGASIAISSTMIVSNVFAERRVESSLKDYVMGVLVVQDVLAIVLAAVLTAVVAGHGLSPGEIAGVVGRLGGVLIAFIVLGLLIIPRLVHTLVQWGGAELLVVVCTGLCFGLAEIADLMGYSVALGAFIAGVLVAESGEGHRVEHLMQPTRDIFAAIFFVAIGMTVDPRLAAAHAGTSLIVFAVVLIAQLLSVTLGSVLSGNGARRAVKAGLSLGQVGEFGFILAAIGTEAGLAPPALSAVVVTVAVLTAFTTPLAIGAADAIAGKVEGGLPQRVRQGLDRYTAWIARLQTPTAPAAKGRQIFPVLLLEALMITAALVGLLLALPTLRGALSDTLPGGWDLVVIFTLAGLLLLIPARELLRASKALSLELSERLFTAQPTQIQQRARRLFAVAMQIFVLLAVATPCVALVLPFTGPWPLLALAGSLLPTAWMLWRAAERGSGPIRSSVERLVDLLSRQTLDTHEALPSPAALAGFDKVAGVRIPEGAPAVGRTLVELEVRSKTGGTVIAIQSEGDSHRLPTGHEQIQAGDLLVLAGTEEAMSAAQALLRGAPAET